MPAGEAHRLRTGEAQLRPTEQLRNLSPEVLEQWALGLDAGIVNPFDGFRIFVHGRGGGAVAVGGGLVARTRGLMAWTALLLEA